MKHIAVTISVLIFASAFASAQLNVGKIGQFSKDKEQAAKLSKVVENTKKTADAGIIIPAHAKYIGTDYFISASKNSCENTPVKNFIKTVISHSSDYSNLDNKNVIYADDYIIRENYMPWHPQDVKTAGDDPDSQRFDELEIARNMLGGAVYSSGDAFILSKVGPEGQYRVYHYKAIRYANSAQNAPFTEVSGYEDSIKFKSMLFEACKVIQRHLPSVSYEYMDMLDKYSQPVNTQGKVFADYYSGDDFRSRFIGDEEIEDIYPQTAAQSVLKLAGVNPDTKTDKITKNVIVAKRVNNTTFFTVSKIGGKLYVHKFVLGKDRKYSVNMQADNK